MSIKTSVARTSNKERKQRSTAASKADSTSYHHGDLRTALLTAAEQILQERGVNGFTLRECARRANVSHAAPAHHFNDARGLLTECAALGYDRMLAMMEASQNVTLGDAEAALVGIGMAYIEFAVTHRALFSLMFRSEMIDQASPQLQLASKRAFACLQQALWRADGGEDMESPDFMRRTMLAWAVVHGIAALILDGGAALHMASVDRTELAEQLGRELLNQLLPSLRRSPQ